MTEPAPPSTEPAEDEEYEDSDEEGDEDEDSDEPAAPPVAAARPAPLPGVGLAQLAGISALCAALGGMFAGGVLGVVAANGGVRPGAAMPVAASLVAVAVAAPAPAADASAPAAPQEANPETAGDGVMDDLDDGPAEPVAAPAPAGASPRPEPRRAGTFPPSPAPSPRPSRRMVTSDDVPEGSAQGYVRGRAVRITVTRIDGKPVEVHTASAYRRMREAAQRDRVALRVVSGFRTMEHQQALYRAWRRGQGNLAAVPGQSNHQSGHALDLNTSSPGVLRWLERNARRFGFRRTVPTEPWHWEWW